MLERWACIREMSILDTQRDVKRVKEREGLHQQAAKQRVCKIFQQFQEGGGDAITRFFKITATYFHLKTFQK